MMVYLGVLWAAFASLAFAILFNVRGRDLPAAALGGALGWAVFLLISSLDHGPALAYFCASAVAALYAELVSRAFKRPATVFLVSSLMPLVPGGGMYYTMSASLYGSLEEALQNGITTLTIAGAMAAGVAVSSAIARLAKRL